MIQALAPSPQPGAFQRLARAYGEGHRHYHSADHITACLALLDERRHLADHPAEVRAAIFYHDAIYDPRRGDNEERSAEWARADLLAHGVGAGAIDRITAMIIATKLHQATTRDQQLLLDIDLSILGAEEEEFMAYDRAIRLEYSHVSDEGYRRGRASVLAGFLARGRIYGLDEFRGRFEDRARRNLAGAIAQLRGKSRSSG